MIMCAGCFWKVRVTCMPLWGNNTSREARQQAPGQIANEKWHIPSDSYEITDSE